MYVCVSNYMLLLLYVIVVVSAVERSHDSKLEDEVLRAAAVAPALLREGEQSSALRAGL